MCTLDNDLGENLGALIWLSQCSQQKSNILM